MSFKSELTNILDNNANIVEYELNGSAEEPKVFFKLNTGNGKHTNKYGDVYEYDRFYQFRGKVEDTEELKHRLKYRRPPDE